jgi:triosephosphate isomerase (TIM)
MRNRFVIGNWKLNGDLDSNAVLLAAINQRVVQDVVQESGKFCGVCVPFVYLPQAQSILANGNVGWGAQDVSRYIAGAYTGEISAKMLSEFDCRYALVGHSERRAMLGDTDVVVAEKFGNTKKAGLTPVLCVGETLDERSAGNTENVVMRQLRAVVEIHGVAALSGAILAYEPVWAIGTGKTATPDEAEAVHAFLRAEIGKLDVEIAASMPILYGGSVKKANAKELFAMPNIDGGLIGGASLVADEFLGIWQAL